MPLGLPLPPFRSARCPCNQTPHQPTPLIRSNDSMHSTIRLSLFSALLAMTATAAAQQASTVSESPAAAATAAPVAAPAAATGHIAPPPQGKVQIVFFRPSKFAGGAFGFKVREGTTELGKLRSGNYFVATVEPGAHQYVVHSEAKDILNMEVEAGETYYVEGTMTMGFMAGHPNLSPSTQATFDGMFSKLDRVQ